MADFGVLDTKGPLLLLEISGRFFFILEFSRRSLLLNIRGRFIILATSGCFFFFLDGIGPSFTLDTFYTFQHL